MNCKLKNKGQGGFRLFYIYRKGEKTDADRRALDKNHCHKVPRFMAEAAQKHYAYLPCFVDYQKGGQPKQKQGRNVDITAEQAKSHIALDPLYV